MTSLAAVYGPESLLGRLADPAARALVLAALVGIALAALRVRSTAARLFAWTAVLYAALAMPILGSLLPAVPVHLPNLPFALPKALVSAPATASVSASASAPASASATTSATAAAIARPVPSVTISRSSSTSSIVARRSHTSAASAFFPRNEATLQASTSGQTSLSHATFTAPSTAAPARTPRPISWLAVAIAVYLFVAACLLARFALGLALARRLMFAADEIRESRALAHLERHSLAAGLRALPRLAESEAVSVPVTLGVRQPSILLPADWREWDDAKLVAVLAHELSHVARRDALTQRLSQIHRALFWFSPLAWWLDRRLADLAEEASDEAALSGGVDRADYARTLLGFFEALQATRGRVWWQGVAMAKAGQAERRVDRILAWKGAVSMSLRKSIVVLLAILAVPVLYLTAGLRPDLQAQDQAVTPPAQPAAPTAAPAPRATPYVTGVPSPAPAPAATPGPAELPAPVAGVTPVAPIGTITPMPPRATIAPMAPLGTTRVPRPQIAMPYASVTPPPAPGAAPRAGVPGGIPYGVVAPTPLATPWPRSVSVGSSPYVQSGQSTTVSSSSTNSSGKDYAYAYGEDDDGQRYVIVSGNSDSVTMSGDNEDARHARALRKKIPGDFIWFERDEKSYVIRDQATVDRVRKLFAPQEALGKQQEELGKQQEALGEQQEELGKKMEAVRVKVPDMTADIEKLKAEIKALQDGGTQEQLGNLQSEIGELQSKIGELQSHAGDQQGKLGDEMGKLGDQQGKLGEQQGRLGRKQGELAREAAIEMRHIFDEAIAKGSAQPEP
jgi:beta-lactamase regulating signal transducer with metallopeptidase domain